MAHVWFVIALAVPMIDALLTKMPAPDLAYQIRAGDIMLRTHSLLVPTSSRSRCPAQPWLNQQWGAQLFLGATYRLGGWNAMVLMHAALKSLAFAFLFLACRRRGVSTRTAALLSVAGFWVARQNLAMRPQLIARPALLRHAMDPGGTPDAPSDALWAIPALMLVWVNVHGSFVLVPVLLGSRLARGSEGITRNGSLAHRRLRRDASPPRWRTRSGSGVWVYAAAIGTNSTISAAGDRVGTAHRSASTAASCSSDRR